MKGSGEACSLETRLLFQIFLRQLSACSFEWDGCKELQSSGIRSPTDQAIAKAINKNELALHFKRKTRGVKKQQKQLRIFC